MTKLPLTRQERIPRIEHGRRPGTRGVVCHTTQGSANSAVRWFKNPQAGGVGAHLLVSRWWAKQLADLDALCWHAVGANSWYVGFEHGGYAEWPRWRWKLRVTQRKLSARRAAWVLYHYHLGPPRIGVNVFGHVDFPQGGHVDPGKGWPWDLWLYHCRKAYKKLVATGGKSWK